MNCMGKRVGKAVMRGRLIGFTVGVMSAFGATAGGYGTSVLIMEPTTSIPTPCIQSIHKSYVPNITAPTSIIIRKGLSMTTVSCSVVQTLGNANCVAPFRNLQAFVHTRPFASAGCEFSCDMSCGTITINIADGLPVELLDFSVH